MYYSLIRKMDIANGPGIRVSLFVSGCKFNCPDCFNPETHHYNNGSPYTIETEQKILSLLSKPYVRGLSILGGDPLWQSYDDIREYLLPLVQKVKLMDKDVWLWTGFKWEDIIPINIRVGRNYQLQSAQEEWTKQWRKDLICSCDVIVDGQFEVDKKDLTLPYSGSTNQRVIDVKKSLKTGDIILYGQEK